MSATAPYTNNTNDTPSCGSLLSRTNLTDKCNPFRDSLCSSQGKVDWKAVKDSRLKKAGEMLKEQFRDVEEDLENGVFKVMCLR